MQLSLWLPAKDYTENLGILGRSFPVQFLEYSPSLWIWDAIKGMKEKEREKEGGRESEFYGERNCEPPHLNTLIFILTSMRHIFKIFSIKARKKNNFLCKAAFILRLQFLFAFLMPFSSSTQPSTFSLIWHKFPPCPFLHIFTHLHWPYFDS